MASELEKLLVKLEADTSGLRRALQNAENGVGQYEQKTERTLGRVEGRWRANAGQIGNHVKTIVAAYASVAAAQASISAASDVSAVANMVGLTTERYQEMRFAALQSGVAHETFGEALKKFNENLGQLRTNTGPLRDWMRQFAPDTMRALQATTSLESAFNVMSDAVARLGTAGERAEMTQAAFGQRNDELVLSLSRGSSAFNLIAGSARDFNAVMNDDVIKSLAAAKKEIENWSNSGIVSFGNALAAARGYYTTIRSLATEWWNEELARDQARRDGGGGNVGPTQGETQVAIARLGDISGAFRGVAAAAVAAGEGWAATVTRANALRIKPDYTFADQLMRFERERATLSGSTLETIRVNLTHEQETFRRLVEENKITEAQAQRLRVELHENASAQIRRIYDEEKQKVRESLQPYQDALNNALGGAIDSVIDGKRLEWKAFVSSMIADLAKVGMRKGIMEPLTNSLFGGITTGLQSRDASSGFGDFMSLMSTAFPMRAGGGDIRAGSPVMVGERRPEVFVPSTPGRIVPQERYSSAGGGSGGSVYNIDARNAQIGVEERILAIMASLERGRPRASAVVAGDRRRFPTRKF